MKLAPSHPVHLVLGFVVWSVWFVAVYAGLSLACDSPDVSFRTPYTWINAALLLTTGITAAALFGAGYWCWNSNQSARFIVRIAAGIYFSAGIATLAVGAPLIALPPCW